ncbi:hypothetical protein CEP52_003234 [Fusarium oligoseptatum]|uniref:Uncharacterized protein n=1 Tax=Fusarium oligoseptatum TaxID=2604345 RepID=A0A428U9Q0_9HYPO|nr:hypothetical protein CEP52_003234 [Fusarium oligoseptatum]
MSFAEVSTSVPAANNTVINTWRHQKHHTRLLLASLVESGYLPEYGPGLVQLMSQNSNGMMTLDVDRAGKKKEFINVIEKDPYKAVEQILGPSYDHAYFQRMSIYSWETVNLGDYDVFRHRGLIFVPITIPYPPIGEPYPFHDDDRPGVPTSMPFDAHFTVLRFDAVMH